MYDIKTKIDLIKNRLTSDQVVDLLEGLGSTICHKYTKTDQIKCTCLNPYHEDKNPSANYSMTLHKLHCFSCNYKGDLIQILQDVRQISFNEAMDFLCGMVGLTNEITVEYLSINIDNRKKIFAKNYDKEKIKLENVELPGYFSANWRFANEHILKYITKRKFNLRSFEEWAIGYCNRGFWQYRIIIPFTFFNKIVGFTGRSVLDEKEYNTLGFNKERPYAKYMHKASTHIKEILFGLNRFYKPEDPFFVEGAFDCIRMQNYGLNCYSTLSNKLSDSQATLIKKYFKGTLYLLPDNDSPGRYLVEEFKNKLGRDFDIKICHYNCSDPDQMLKEDVVSLKENAKNVYEIFTNLPEIDITTVTRY